MSNDNNSKNVIMNDEEKSLLLNHDYDGIEEFDYPLPDWWKGTFIGGIVFAVLYILYYSFAGGPSLRDNFELKMAKMNELRAEQAKLTGNFQIEEYQAWFASNDHKKQGLEVYEENCLSCHEANGKGDIGPNLTDKYWLNLKEVNEASVYQFVVKGNEDNGMPAWGDILSKEEIYASVAYVLSLRNTNVAGGKEPQGEVLD